MEREEAHHVTWRQVGLPCIHHRYDPLREPHDPEQTEEATIDTIQ
jgi:hypothetical protein